MHFDAADVHVKALIHTAIGTRVDAKRVIPSGLEGGTCS